MPSVVYRTVGLLGALLAPVPVGTNLALFSLLWALLSGRFLASRGAIFPALDALALSAPGVRRAWRALHSGAWEVSTLLAHAETWIQAEARWQPHRHDQLQPVVCDLVGFFRPKLQDCPSTHYSSAADKALPAISLGLAVAVGSVDGHRVPLLRHLTRLPAGKASESALQQRLLHQVAASLGPQEAVIADRGFPLRQVLAAQLPRFVVRLPRNCAFRRATRPLQSGRGRPRRYGAWVRPLARTRKGQPIPATPPDWVQEWEEAGVQYRAECWEQLVPSTTPAAAAGEALPAETCACLVLYNPAFAQPLVLAVRGTRDAPAAQRLYADRWQVERLPLAAKQLLGTHRQYVSNPQCCQRLPELALLAGGLLPYLAATEPTVPTGFWDRRPQATPGRVRRVLARTPFSLELLAVLPERFRKKESVTAHLPWGIRGHRRQKAVRTAPEGAVPPSTTPDSLHAPP